MTSLLDVPLGHQDPLLSLAPPADDFGDADDAVFLASSYGLVPDPWQALVLRHWMGRRDGKWAATRCGLSVPRQNGKNGALEVRELFGMVQLGEKILHTAHEVKTARKAFKRLLSFFDNPKRYPELAALVVEIRKTNGQEAIILANGGSVEFIARSKGSGRGFTVDVLVCDEAQELGDDAYSALLPTISAAPLRNPQRILTGTPPGPGMDGEVFTRLRGIAMAGVDTRVAWDQWSFAPGADLSDPVTWGSANPAMPERLDLATVADEFADMEPTRFARERGGVWDDPDSANRLVPLADWNACLDMASQITGAPSFALDVSPNHSWSAIAAAGMNQAGRLHVEVTSFDEVVDHKPGTEWVIPRMLVLKAAFPGLKVLIAAGSGAESLRIGLETAGITVESAALRDVKAACGLFYDYATTERLAHRGQPELDSALASAKKRVEDGEDAWVWGRKRSAGDITSLYAATLALHTALGAMNLSRHPINNIW